MEDLWARSRRSRPRERARDGGRPRRDHRGHGRQPPGHDERDQSRRRVAGRVLAPGSTPQGAPSLLPAVIVLARSARLWNEIAPSFTLARRTPCLAREDTARDGASRIQEALSPPLAARPVSPALARGRHRRVRRVPLLAAASQLSVHPRRGGKPARRRCACSAPQKLRLQRRLADSDTPEALDAGGAPPRLREAGRAALHRQGHQRVAPPARRPLASARTLPSTIATWTIASSSSGSSAAARVPFGASSCAARSARRPSPSRPPTTSRAIRSRRPTTSPARHLVAAISRLEAAGGVERWSEAAQGDPDLAESLARATAEQRRVRGRARRLESRAPMREPRSSSASAARETRSSSSACTPTPRSRWRARATSWASGSLPRSTHSGPGPVA